MRINHSLDSLSRADRTVNPVSFQLSDYSLTHMKITFLEFEQNIAEFESKIEELRFAQDDSALDISAEIARLQAKSQSLTKNV